jgi:hypothetical protein
LKPRRSGRCRWRRRLRGLVSLKPFCGTTTKGRRDPSELATCPHPAGARGEDERHGDEKAEGDEGHSDNAEDREDDPGGGHERGVLECVREHETNLVRRRAQLQVEDGRIDPPQCKEDESDDRHRGQRMLFDGPPDLPGLGVEPLEGWGFG